MAIGSSPTQRISFLEEENKPGIIHALGAIAPRDGGDFPGGADSYVLDSILASDLNGEA